MSFNRRDFIKTAAGAAAFGAAPGFARAEARPEPKFIWSYLVHFGVNSWKDIPLETQDPSLPEKWLTRCCADHVRFDEPSWLRLSDALAKAGCNQIIIDLAEIVVYPSHPELAVKGSWSVVMIQPPIMKLFTTKKMRQVKMEQSRPVSKAEKKIGRASCRERV